MNKSIKQLLDFKKNCYGEDIFSQVAVMWSSYLNLEIALEPDDIMLMFILYKTARYRNTKKLGTDIKTTRIACQDSVDDILGYSTLFREEFDKQNDNIHNG